MTKDIPKISIVTVVYNGEQVIEDTILSVLGQNYPNLEYIVVDGNSKDNTPSIIKQYKNRIDTYLREADKGVYDAMNKGIELATGDWILFMNAGDRFYSNSSVSDFFAQYKNKQDDFSVLYGDAQFRLKNIAYVVEASRQVNTNEYMPFSHQAVFTRTDVARKNKFDLNYKIAADTAFFLRLVREGHNFCHISVTVCSYNALEGLSVDNEVERCKEIVDLQAKWNNIDPTNPHFKSYIRNARIKQNIRRMIPQFLWIRLRERSVSKKYNNVTKIK